MMTRNTAAAARERAADVIAGAETTDTDPAGAGRPPAPGAPCRRDGCGHTVEAHISAGPREIPVLRDCRAGACYCLVFAPDVP